MSTEEYCTMETVYGFDDGACEDDTGRGISDRVQTVARTIYHELEHMIPTYGEEVIKEIMPHVVSLLESLDSAYKKNEEKDAELELCRDDNEQLMTQYEKEKQLRRAAEQRLMTIEDLMEDERRETSEKLDSMQSVIRTYELKAKNSADHLQRLEEKEAEQKKEYVKLHERYTELFKKHMDHVEKSKLLMGVDQMMSVSGHSMRKSLHHVGGPMQFGDLAGSGFFGMQGSFHGVLGREEMCEGANMLNEFGSVHTAEKNMNTDMVVLQERGISTSNGQSPDFGDAMRGAFPAHRPARDSSRGRHHSGNPSSAFDELLDTEASADMDDVTGAVVNPAEFSSTGMSKEVENLILENQELLATKNALNVVKDDLIAQLDEILSEQVLLKDEVASVKAAKEKLNARVVELEEETKKCRETIETYKLKSQDDEEDDVPMAQRKRFTRVEMARVLMERNQYKERLMELQEAVRWTEMIRASREHPDLVHGTSGASTSPGRKRSNIWNFFSNLFNASNKVSKRSSPSIRYTAPTSSPQRRPAARSPRASPKLSVKSKVKAQKLSAVISESDNVIINPRNDNDDSSEQFCLVRARVKTESGRMQAYGWSLPAKGSSVSSIIPPVALQKAKGQMPVPVPVYCKPHTATDSTMKLWCAAGTNLPNPDEADEGADKTLSIVWICATSQSEGHTTSVVSVVNTRNPAKSLDTFNIVNSHILCIASISGVEDSVADVEVVSHWENSLCDSVSGDGSFEIGIKLVDCTVSTDDDVSPAEVADLLKKPTMWLGAQDGCIYIYSAAALKSRKLCQVKLPDTVLSIHYVANRVFVALANGCVAAFCRQSGNSWKLDSYYNLCLGRPQHSVRCMCVIGQQAVWCGYRSKVHVINAGSLALQKSFDAHTRSESQVRQMVCMGDGVWLTMRLDSTLRLYHAVTCQHLQDVDIEPYVSKMLGTGKLGFSFVRITSLLAACNRLWIGTGNGVIICVPLSENSKQLAINNKTSEGVYHAYNNASPPPAAGSDTTATAAPAVAITAATDTNLPYCYMAQAQLSFHGHKDAVKFFVAVPSGKCSSEQDVASPRNETDGSSRKETTLIMSGGEGYVDFRTGSNNTGDIEEELDEGAQQVENGTGLGKPEYSQIIVWEVYG